MSCQHQGEKDVRRHIEGKKHCDNLRDSNGISCQLSARYPKQASAGKSQTVHFFAASALYCADLVAAESVVRNAGYVSVRWSGFSWVWPSIYTLGMRGWAKLGRLLGLLTFYTPGTRGFRLSSANFYSGGIKGCG